MKHVDQPVLESLGEALSGHLYNLTGSSLGGEATELLLKKIAKESTDDGLMDDSLVIDSNLEVKTTSSTMADTCNIVVDTVDIESDGHPPFKKQRI